jgi:hypothetical protein
MVAFHQSIPYPGGFALTASYPYQFNTTQFLQITAHRANLLNGPLSLYAGLKRWFAITLRQLQNPLSLHFQQGHTATHLFEFAIGAFPIKPLANSKGKSPPRDRGLGSNRFIYFTDYLVRKVLTANQHGNKLNMLAPPVSSKNLWDMDSFAKGD